MFQFFEKIYISRKKAILIIGSLLTLTLVTYIYFVNSTIFNIVERQNTLREMVLINSRVSDLQTNYGTLRNTLSYDYANTRGFVEPQKRTFVSEKRLV